MKLVPDWRNWWRWLSTWVAGLIPLWAAMPEDIKAHIPEWLLPYLPAIWAVVWMWARTKPQAKPPQTIK